MSEHSAIEWTNATWNPVTGCTKVSPGCKNCYAERLAERLQAAGSRRYRNGFALTLHPDVLELPLRWRKPRMIFVNSMSDLFHEEVPDDFIDRVFAVMALSPQHTFQVLTKRAKRMHEYMNQLLDERDMQRWHNAAVELVGLPQADEVALRDWPLPNVWLGVSVEDQKRADERIPDLVATPAVVRFLSCEPLLGPISFRWAKWHPYYPDGWRERSETQGHLDGLRGIDWVIVGGESGPGHRPMDPEWARSIRDQCVAAGVPYFFKQWGGATSKSGGRTLDGRTWDDMPRLGV